jgi:hypothetical protein
MVTEKSCVEKELHTLEKWTTFKLPNKAKPIGWVLAIGCLISFLWLAKTPDPSFLLLYSIKTAGVIGLAMVVLAKEKMEDEMIGALRGKAMLFAFICSIFLIIITPYITTIMSAIVSDNFQQIAVELSHFNMLSCLLLMYILGFEGMKKIYK